MSASYPSMFAFGLVLLAAWAGWGVALERLIMGRAAADRALHAGWGMAATVLVGGLLNLAGAISPTTIHVFLAGGLVLLAWDGWRRRSPTWRRLRERWQRLQGRPLLALAALAVLGMMVVAYAAKVCSKDYNVHDDLQAYFVFPAKMIQTGAMGPDPFSEARLLSLGGMSFLQATVLSVADARYFRLVEPAVALLLGVGLVLGAARDARASPWVALLGAFLLLAVPPPAVNAASLVTGLALFLTLFRTLLRMDRGEPPDARGAVLVALTASALCALKTTHVPSCALMVVIAYLLRARRAPSPRAVVAQMLLAGALTFVFLAPWMLASWESGGTPLYPLFGRGFHGSAYGNAWAPTEAPAWSVRAERVWSAWTDLKVAPVWIMAGGLLIRRRGRSRPGALAAFSLGALAPIVALAGTHPGAYRYSWAGLWAATIVLVIESCREATTAPRGGGARVWPSAAVSVSLAALVLAHGTEVTRYWPSRLQRIEISVEQSRSPGFKRGAAFNGSRMLEAVPEGATLLARLRYPFVLDFRRHTIFVANYPGGASPPPGMPSFQGAEPLARYLCDQSVRYVAYSYRTEANFQRERFGDRLGPEEFSWTRAQAQHALDFQDNLVELGHTRRRIFDDGDVFVLDLGVSPDGGDLGCGSA